MLSFRGVSVRAGARSLQVMDGFFVGSVSMPRLRGMKERDPKWLLKGFYRGWDTGPNVIWGLFHIPRNNYRILKGGPRGGGNWGTLRIPFGKIGEP